MALPAAWDAESRVALAHALWIVPVWWATDALGWGVAAALASYLLSHLRHAAHLHRWLSHSRTGYPPDGTGIWNQILKLQSERQREHRARKQRLARMVVRLQRSTRAVPDALVILNADFEIQWTNDAAQSLLGVSAPRDVGQRIDFFIRHPAFGAFIHTSSSGACMLRSPVQSAKYLEVRLFPIAEADSLLIAQDATERLRIEQMRKDFVADVSHELRTPLTVLSGYLENMTRDPNALPDTWRRPVLSMHEQTARMRRIVEDLLLLASLEGGSIGEQERIDVAALVQTLASGGRELSGSRQHVITVEADGAVQLLGVRAEIEKAFANLVSNAVQYTPDGGNIAIRWYADAERACFEVADSGEGIAEEHIPRLTERFFRVDRGRSREQGGTGLGLSIVKHALERHGATLEIDSTPTKGSVFRCVFMPTRIVAHPGSRGGDADAQKAG